MEKLEIVKFAIYSRLGVIVLQCLSRLLVPHHDAGVFLYPKNSTSMHNGLLDDTINFLFGGFKSWDGQYFMHIALNGYTYENSAAFFPLLPLAARLGSLIIPKLLASTEEAILLSFILINLVLFVLCALRLYDLTRLFTNDKKFCSKVIFIFIFNPASVFFTAVYTECLFAYLTFSLIYYSMLEKYLKASIYLGLSIATRSNGLINIGFLVYFLMFNFSFSKAFLVVISIITSLVPFGLYQVYIFNLFCKNFDNSYIAKHVRDYAEQQKFVLPGEYSKHNQEWCSHTLPLSYNYIQEHYWNVGFLEYYEFKQIPNFILATPVIYICLTKCASFLLIKNNLNEIYKLLTKNKMKQLGIKYHLVYIAHCWFLTLVCMLFIHIQVSTRFLCAASPAVYWFLSETKWANVYCISYYIIGTILFSNFYPWT